VARSTAPIAIGAGTVLSIEAAERAIDAGASFLVSPHTDPELVRWAADRGVPMLPGRGHPDRGPRRVAGRGRRGRAGVVG
jgi:2-dehydro-3-deoxyphosphogluconate aldolase/(4S)-4-hydroxy-2-oxoglutarate aldolase